MQIWLHIFKEPQMHWVVFPTIFPRFKHCINLELWTNEFFLTGFLPEANNETFNQEMINLQILLRILQWSDYPVILECMGITKEV